MAGEFTESCHNQVRHHGSIYPDPKNHPAGDFAQALCSLAPRTIRSSAGKKGLYDSLHETDICSFLREGKASFDLFLAADVV